MENTSWTFSDIAAFTECEFKSILNTWFLSRSTPGTFPGERLQLQVSSFEFHPHPILPDQRKAVVLLENHRKIGVKLVLNTGTPYQEYRDTISRRCKQLLLKKTQILFTFTLVLLTITSAAASSKICHMSDLPSLSSSE